MEQYFRIIIWTFFLLTFSGHLQGTPLPLCPSLHVKHLPQVSCRDNVTLTSPTNVQKHCRAAALKVFKEGLEYAKNNCQDENERIFVTLYNLNTCSQKIQCSPDTQSDTAACKWESEGSRKQFADFVKDFEAFIQLLKSSATE